MNSLGDMSSHKAKQACLVVEDSEVDQRLIRRVLSRRGAFLELHFAQSLKEARESLETMSFQLILLDNNLPDGFGADFAMELAGDPKHRNKPIIMFGDWPSPFMRDKACKAGVYYVLNKAEFHFDYVKQTMDMSVRRLQRARV